MRTVVEEGLRLALDRSPRTEPYRLPDRSVGDPDAADPLEALSDELPSADRDFALLPELRTRNPPAPDLEPG